MADPYDEYFLTLLDKNPKGFLKTLDTNIVKGDHSKDETLKQLRVISSYPKCEDLLCRFRDGYGDCLIHNVAKFHKSTNVLKYLLTICPKLLLAERTDQFAGQTALHIVVTKLNLKAAKTILKHAGGTEELHKLLHVQATGSLFKNTVMMGELALSIAALTLKESMVDLLLKYGARVPEQNSKGDTVFHCLIRYAAIHPEKLDEIINMIEHINGKLSSKQISLVWYNAENDENLTALKLAASLGQVQIFSSILNLEDVYCKLNHHDGLFDIHLFDITEIDTITQAEWERNKEREKRARKLSSADDTYNFHRVKKKPAAQSHHPALIHTCPAVLDIICRMPTATAFQLMNVEVVKDVVTTKWAHYRHFYYLWFLIHFLMMSVITAYAVFKTEVINDHIYPSSNVTNYDTTQAADSLVIVTSILSVVYASPYLVYEVFRSVYFKQPWHLEIIHHNGLYRCLMVVMAVALVIDAIWFWINPDNNYFLIIALLVGWTFMNFFLRALRIFSFFTVMLQKVLLGDMTRFSVIILFQLVAFSIAMYITFLNTRPQPSEFAHLGMAMMTMFKLMLGLTDIEILYDARHPWMAIFLYIACALVTYVLLINSLIALMSQTCALVSEDRRMQWSLQRLSVIHLVETMLLPRWRYLHKAGLKARRYNLDNQATEWRCFNEITSLQTTYTDGAAILRRKSMIRTIGFDDSVFSPMAPFLNKLRTTRIASSMHYQNIPIDQNHVSLRGKTITEEEDLDLDSSDEEQKYETIQIKKPGATLRDDEVFRNETSLTEKENDTLTKQTRIHSTTDNITLTERSESSPKQTGSSVTITENKDNNKVTATDVGKLHNLHVGTKPRKRHNSDTVNRKTQTVTPTPLSHSFPDGGLRTPLRQGELQQAPSSSVDNINPRIVYVVPTSVFNQSGLTEMRAMGSGDNILTPHITSIQGSHLQHNVPTSEDVYAQVLRPNPPRLRDASSEGMRQQWKIPEVTLDPPNVDHIQPTPSSGLPVASKVQKLDIDTLHSNSNA